MKINCHVSGKSYQPDERRNIGRIEDDGRIVLGTEEANERLP
jgi:hypothetical protein